MTGAKIAAVGIGIATARIIAPWLPPTPPILAVAIDLSPTTLVTGAAASVIGLLQWSVLRQIAARDAEVAARKAEVAALAKVAADLTDRLTRLEERHAALAAIVARP